MVALTNTQLIMTIAIIAGVTVMTRALPFILFPAGKKTPGVVAYLGSALPYACIAMLVVYCFKNISFTGATHGIPEIIAGAFVVIVHKWRHNLFLSIVGGTALYMLLIQVVFA